MEKRIIVILGVKLIDKQFLYIIFLNSGQIHLIESNTKFVGTMVYPDIEYLDTGDGRKHTLPRIRQYVSTRTSYEAVVQPHDNNKSFPLVKFSKLLFSKFDDADIYFISKKKMRIVSKNRTTINQIVKDEIRKEYKIFIPLELCETKAVVQIPSDVEYTEQYIFENTEIKHLAEYGPLRDVPQIVEVKRFTKPDDDGNRTEIDLVMFTFTGDSLPSHIALDRIIFPVKPFIEKVTQCKKCWRLGHSEKVCRRSKGVCSKCGSSHEGTCDKMPMCVNCGKFHDAKDYNCEKKYNLRQEAKDRAYARVPKKSEYVRTEPMTENIFSLREEDFPLLSNKRKKVEVKDQNSRKRKTVKIITQETPTEHSPVDNSVLNLDSDDLSLSKITTPIEGKNTQSINTTEQIFIQPAAGTQLQNITTSHNNAINSVNNPTSSKNDNVAINTILEQFENFQQSVQTEIMKNSISFDEHDENLSN